MRQPLPIPPPRASLADLPGLTLAVGICLLPGLLVAALTRDDVAEWYPTLEKPWFTPPAWLFGPVWTILYVFMGVALWRLWRVRPSRRRRVALALFGLQLVLNAGWSLLFFEWRSPGVAFAEIVLLWSAVSLLIRSVLPLDGLAAALLIPYLVWTGFAAVLNLAIVLLQ